MKKISIFIGLIFISFTLVGCNFVNNSSTNTTATFPSSSTTSSNSLSTTTTLNTDTAQTTQTTTSIDASQIESAVYSKIYQDIYNEVKTQVMQNLSDQQFTEIYNTILSELQQEVADGTITITPQTIVDKIKSVEANAAQAVIGVSNLDSTGQIKDIGSGVIYKHDGDKYYVVTNNHVVEGGTSYQIRFSDGSTADATLLGVDSLVDVAVLSFTSTNDYYVATFANSDNVQTGDIVLAVGNPNGYDFYDSMTFGIVSGTNRYFDIDGDGVKDLFVGYIQHDAAINPGNSGGALFNLQGQVLGLNVIKLSDVSIEGMGFAIPGNLVQAICSDIEQYGYSIQKPMLGIQFLDIYNNEAAFQQQGITLPAGVTNGFYVTAVTPGSSVDGYVQVGDIITQIGDITIQDSDQFITQFTKYKVGDVISIHLIRNGQPMTIDNITLKAKATS